MQLITKKNYIPVVCIVYTCWVLFKLISEEFVYHMKDTHYVSNLIWAFILVALGIALLGLSALCSEWPLWLVILMQYGILMAVVMGSIWIEGHFTELASTAYRDMFRSVSIPFAVIAVIYYWKCYHELKKSNEILDELNGEKEE